MEESSLGETPGITTIISKYTNIFKGFSKEIDDYTTHLVF